MVPFSPSALPTPFMRNGLGASVLQLCPLGTFPWLRFLPMSLSLHRGLSALAPPSLSFTRNHRPDGSTRLLCPTGFTLVRHHPACIFGSVSIFPLATPSSSVPLAPPQSSGSHVPPRTLIAVAPPRSPVPEKSRGLVSSTWVSISSSSISSGQP